MEDKKDKGDCGVCGENLNNNNYIIKLDCNHYYHYKCIFNSYKSFKKTLCPYCSQPNEKLPYINGCHRLPQYDKYIIDNDNQYQKCDYIFKKGKNKGKACQKHTKLGFYKCSLHL